MSKPTTPTSGGFVRNDGKDTPYWEMFVPGAPITEGSTRAFKHAKTKRVIVRHDNDRKLRAWRESIRQCAAIYRITPASGVLIPKPKAVRLSISFMLPKPDRPMNKFSPVVKPDLDKLVRAVGDALGEARIFTDDSQIINFNAWKHYAPTPDLVGALICISTSDDQLIMPLSADVEYRINQLTTRPRSTPYERGERA